MQDKLNCNYLKQALSLIEPQLIDQARFIIEHNRIDLAIAYCEQKAANQEGAAKHNSFYEVMEFIFEFALSLNAHSFIEKLLTQPEAVSHIDQGLLWQYSKSMGDDQFRKKVLEAILKNHSKVFVSGRTLYHDFTEATWKLFKSTSWPVMDDSASVKLLRDILHAPNLSVIDIKSLVAEFVISYCTEMARTDNARQHGMLMALFYQFAPQQTVEHKRLIVSYLLSYSALDEQIELFRAVVRQALVQFKIDQADIVQILLEKDIRIDSVVNYLSDLVKYLPADQPECANYHRAQQLFALPLQDRPQFIINNSDLLEPNSFSGQFHYRITQAFNRRNCEPLLIWYCEHANFEGSYFQKYFCSYGIELAKKYLSAAHTEVPLSALELVVHNFCNEELHALLALLHAKHYHYAINTLVRPLRELFVQGDIKAITLILEHPQVHQVMKNYFVEKGDDYLLQEERTTLLPSVLAWYAQKGRFPELFMAYTPEQQTQLLNSPLLEVINQQGLILKSFLIQSGQHEIIELIGGLHPRLVSLKPNQPPVIMLPNRWQNPRVVEHLSQFQRRFVTTLAIKKWDSYETKQKPIEISATAKKLANLHGKQSITLFHQSYATNTDAIINSGKLQIRHHLMGRTFTGQHSKGLTHTAFDTFGPHSLCSFFTRKPKNPQYVSGLSVFNNLPEKDKISFSLDLFRLLAAHPRVNHIYLRPYSGIVAKQLKFSDAVTIDSEKNNSTMLYADLRKITFSSPDDAIQQIHEHLFDYFINQFLASGDSKIKDAVIERLLNATTTDQFVLDALDLISLEWFLPGDVPLHLDYVDQITLGNAHYDLAQLRVTVSSGTEQEILTALDSYNFLQQLPFLQANILAIAVKRELHQVVKKISLIKTNRSSTQIMRFYPDEIYQIESLAQLILEDCNNDRVYVEFADVKLSFEALLKHNNREGAHHAEMPKLRYALGDTSLVSLNAMTVNSNNRLTIEVGTGRQFATLAAVRDAMLTYELTTLCACHQNAEFYFETHGNYHPVTGKGATNAAVALLPQRLFHKEQAYTLTAVYKEDGLHIHCDLTAGLAQIRAALHSLLPQVTNHITVAADELIIRKSPSDLIAALRRAATFYNGLNVITADGGLLVAYRKNRGLASAGGHHSEKYDRYGIAYGLKSEFGLVFKETKALNQCHIISNAKSTPKTNIYVIPADQLTLLGSTKAVDNFTADPEEFVEHSELVLQPAQMRGLKFYDVMPLPELCNFQLQGLIEFLNSTFPEAVKTISMDTRTDVVWENQVCYQVPQSSFGQIKLVISPKAPLALIDKLCDHGQVTSAGQDMIIMTDISPYRLRTLLQESLQLKPQKLN